MTKQNVFRGVTAVQRSLIDYWCRLGESDGVPRRESIDPGHLRSMLASISIVEFDEFYTAERSREMLITGFPPKVQENFSLNVLKPPVHYYLTGAALGAARRALGPLHARHRPVETDG